MDNFDVDPELIEVMKKKFGITEKTFRKRADFQVKSKNNKESIEKVLYLIKQLRDEESSC